MKVTYKHPSLEAIQWLGDENLDDVLKFLNGRKTVNAEWVYQPEQLQGDVAGRTYLKVSEHIARRSGANIFVGDWAILEPEEGTIQVYDNAQFELLFQEVGKKK